MGMQINTNVAANNAYRNLNNTQSDLSKSLEKLSSGLRINRAADDAAGLAISQGLKSQVGGLTVAARNAQDGISVVQTAEGSLTEVHSILQRVRDLAVQAGNDSNNADSRTDIQTEVTQLTDELTRIAGSRELQRHQPARRLERDPDVPGRRRWRRCERPDRGQPGRCQRHHGRHRGRRPHVRHRRQRADVDQRSRHADHRTCRPLVRASVPFRTASSRLSAA